MRDKEPQAMKQPQRTLAQIKAHYEIEKKLAQRLLNSTHQERQTLYTTVYEELFKSVPDHPQLTIKSSPEESNRRITKALRHIKPFLKKETTFLEIGAGDCALSYEIAKVVKRVFAIDVSELITRSFKQPSNFKLILSDGTSIPVPENSIDVAYSNQLMEHLHPEDALEQLKNIYDAIVPGGVYICITQNRLNGPHDISRYFDRVASGFHLKEYTIIELEQLFKKTGFSKVKLFVPIKLIGPCFPLFPGKILEIILSPLPYTLRKSCASFWPIAKLLGVRLVAIK